MVIHSDLWGLYVVTNGQIYRPQPSTYSYYVQKAKGYSDYKEGLKVKGHAIRQTPLALVGDETWFTHGLSPQMLKACSGEIVESSAVWRPKIGYSVA